MPNVHFTWIGDAIPNLSMLIGPLSLEKHKCPELNIYLWIPEALMEKAQRMFASRNINVRSVERMLSGEYSSGRLQHIQPDRVRADLRLFQKYNINVAQKDRLSFAILAEFGGYHFDTTVRFSKPPILPEYSTIKFPVLQNNTMPWKIKPDGTLYELPLIDIWAMYSPEPGHRAFKRIDSCYSELMAEKFDADVEPHILVSPTENAEAIGLRSSLGEPATTLENPEYVLSLPAGKLREFFISGISIFSAYQGLSEEFNHTLSKEAIDSVSWTTQKINPRETFVPELELLKTYFQSWKMNDELSFDAYSLDNVRVNVSFKDWCKIWYLAEELTELQKIGIAITSEIRQELSTSVDSKRTILQYKLTHAGLTDDFQTILSLPYPSIGVQNILSLHKKNMLEQHKTKIFQMTMQEHESFAKSLKILEQNPDLFETYVDLMMKTDRSEFIAGLICTLKTERDLELYCRELDKLLNAINGNGDCLKEFYILFREIYVEAEGNISIEIFQVLVNEIISAMSMQPSTHSL